MTTPDPASRPASRTWHPGSPSACLHLLVLFGFALAQPLFDVLGREPGFFLTRGAQAADLWIFTLGLILVVPLPLLLVPLVLARVNARSARWAHLGFVCFLIALLLFPWLARSIGPWPGFFGAIAAGALVARAYATTEPLRQLLTLSGPAPLVFAALFLARPGIADIAWKPEGAPVETFGTGRADARARTSVVLVVFDQLPVSTLMRTVDEVDSELFPNFARLAATSTWFKNASACYKRTLLALPSILTGRLVRDHRLLPRVEDHPQNLFTLLGGSHRMAVHERITQLCPPELLDVERPQHDLLTRLSALVDDTRYVVGHVVLPKEWAKILPSVTENWGAFGLGGGTPLEAGETLRADNFRRFVDVFDDDERPTLSFLHLMLPHVPWEYVPSGHKIDTRFIREVGLNDWSKHDHLLDLGFQRHILQLGFVDVLLGDLIDRMQELGTWDRSLVIVTSDHGCSLRGLSREISTEERTRDLLHVPLFVKLPGQAAGVVDASNVESIDILPTIADLLEIELPWETDGRSVFAAGPRKDTKEMHNKGGGSVVVDGSFPTLWPALDYKRALFGDAPHWTEIWQLGGAHPFVGKRTNTLPVDSAAPDGPRVHLRGAEALKDWNGEGAIYPGLVLGEVRGAPVPERVALAVGGTVRTVTPTYGPEGERTSFAALLAREDLTPGAPLEVYAVKRTAQGDRLVALAGE